MTLSNHMSASLPTPEQIAKLPKWAQEYVKDLERRVVIAERTLKKYTDTQTPSEFYIDDLLCIGNGTPQVSRKYVQTHRITAERDGVKVDLLLRLNEPGIEVSWSTSDRMTGEIAMIPFSFQKIKLVSKNDMR